MERIREIPPELRREAVEESLKLIAGQIIAAYQANRERTLLAYARQAAIDAAELGGRPNKLFMRLIREYHPDRLVRYLGIIEECVERGDNARLDGLKAFLTPLREETTPARRRDEGPTEAEPEEYGYGEDDFGYSEGSWSGTDDESDDYDGEDGIMEEDGPVDVLEAIKRAYMGNLDAYPSPLELSMMEGELDLSDCGIDDLEGAEYLSCIASLNLSGNAIQNAQPLSRLRALEFLDLSHNQLEDADCLRGCDALAELDLSYNEIEDFSFLESMESLRCVNVLGNPPMGEALAARLSAKDVLVIR